MKKTWIALILCAALALTGCKAAVSQPSEPMKTPVQSGKEEGAQPNDYRPAIMVDGILYFDTGEYSDEARCGVMDGEITSTVPQTQLPTKDNESNFGKCEYQRWDENRIDVLIGDKWCIFKSEDAPAETTATLWIVDGAQDGYLMLAGNESGEIYYLNAKAQGVEIRLDGAAADASALKNGMKIKVKYSTALYTYPMTLSGNIQVDASSETTTKEQCAGQYDLCGLYLKALEDLWNTDTALNDSIESVSVDLSNAPGGLTDGQKDAIAWIFAARHQAECLTMTYSQLRDEGYLTAAENAGDASGKEPAMQWENGILFTVEAPEQAPSAEDGTLWFSVGKWRSPLGARRLENCKAEQDECGAWSDYQAGTQAAA